MNRIDLAEFGAAPRKARTAAGRDVISGGLVAGFPTSNERQLFKIIEREEGTSTQFYFNFQFPQPNPSPMISIWRRTLGP